MNDNSSIESTKFLTKKQRQELALQKLQQQREEETNRRQETLKAHERFITGKAAEERRLLLEKQKEEEEKEKLRREKEEKKMNKEHEHEIKTIRDHYLGNNENKRRIIKPSEKFARIFKFDWDDTDDTTKNDHNPLYTNRTQINALFGRGYIAGVDLREQRKTSNFLNVLNDKRSNNESNNIESNNNNIELDMGERKRQRLNRIDGLDGKHWSDKKLHEMTERDWRIFREDYDIHIQGGRATLPLRYWSEANLPYVVDKAIKDAKYENPSPIQRQAIPIGLLKRDLIGIAETGSGKTCAFLVPLLSYMQELPKEYFDRVADEGPLAVIMAPTRELAQQIEEECKKLARHTKYKTVSIVGGQSIEEQGFILRRGVDICIGTPGRILDCLDNSLMVLNQCNYVVLDEADTMIDMGFEPSVTAILETMGGILKSEDEEQAQNQEELALKGQAIFRITAMFSATMPPAVEKIAKTFLRHPVTVKIGDQDSGKNKRIEQIIIMITENQKRNRLIEDLRKLQQTDKIIVFVNLKKTGDTIGKFLENAGYAVGVLHGGKSQDQREETLELFRNGRIQILVATDVAGRGLDIPDVTYVINFDMTNKIQPYCHRIGRTGRAGKSGTAITYLMDSDTEVMYDLKNYLQSTNAYVPDALYKNPAAMAAPGSRTDSGKLVSAGKKDNIMYLKD